MTPHLAPALLDPVAAFFAHTGRLALFAARTLRTAFSTRPEGRLVLQQCVEVGLESIPVLVTMSIFIGMNLAIEGYATFLSFGGENMIGVFAGMTLVRELCPAIAAAILTAKAGTRMTSTIGLMRIKEQIDALEVMAVDPVRYIVVPRFFGTVLMVPLLVLVSDAVAIGASYLVSTVQLGLDPGAFWYYTVSYLTPTDLTNGMIKGLVFGAIISIMCCHFGYTARKGPEGVGRATNQAVVFTGMAVIAANLMMTNAMYG